MRAGVSISPPTYAPFRLSSNGKGYPIRKGAQGASATDREKTAEIHRIAQLVRIMLKL
jgi:hypothetical protein